MEVLKMVVLALSGILLIYAGLGRLLKPISSLCLKSYADNRDKKLDGEPDVFNEMRAAGSSILTGGLFILLGIWLPQLTLTAFVVAVVIFLGHAIGRLFSLILDGKPGSQMIMGLVLDLGFGLLNLFCLVLMQD